MTSCEPLRGRAYGQDLRWRMVYQREMQGFIYKRIASNLNVDVATVWRAVKRFHDQGSVEGKEHSGTSHKIGDHEQLIIIESVIENPSIYLREIKRKVEDITSKVVSESAICRYLQRSHFSRKKLSYTAAQRSEELRAKFLADIAVYNREMLVVLDESGCDKRHTMRKFGYSLKGSLLHCTP